MHSFLQDLTALKQEDDLLSKRIIVIEDSASKQCFWLNRLNFAILAKFLQIFITDFKLKILEKVDSSIKFYCFLDSTHITVENHQFSVFQVIKQMLGLKIWQFCCGSSLLEPETPPSGQRP